MERRLTNCTNLCIESSLATYVINKYFLNTRLFLFIINLAMSECWQWEECSQEQDGFLCWLCGGSNCSLSSCSIGDLIMNAGGDSQDICLTPVENHECTMSMFGSCDICDRALREQEEFSRSLFKDDNIKAYVDEKSKPPRPVPVAKKKRVYTFKTRRKGIDRAKVQTNNERKYARRQLRRNHPNAA
jgi:hypothetical protein